jgi:hypothetical protein
MSQLNICPASRLLKEAFLGDAIVQYFSAFFLHARPANPGC